MDFINKSFKKISLRWLTFAALVHFSSQANIVSAQEHKQMMLSEAISTGINNYQGIQARRNYLNASSALVQDAKNRYLPNVIASMQQAYGTVNGQYGPVIAAEGMGIASAGPISPSQRWDAAFGGLYLINTNWEVFTFGRAKSGIVLANAAVKRDSADLLQEEFIQSVKIAGAYLNLLTSQKLVQNAQANLQRAMSVQQSVLARTRSGLIAGVDSSIANAELSKAKLALIDSRNNEQQISTQLAQLLNILSDSFYLDSTFIGKIPEEFKTAASIEQNPQAKFYQTRINESNVAATYLKKSIMPGVNLFGVFQTRGSGFDYNYAAATNYKYSSNYFEGIKPLRYNYVTGVALAWNIMSPLKIKQQVTAQKFISEAYKNEYDQVTTQLKNQLLLADDRIENSLQIVHEVPLQYKAAADAYLQKLVLYKNGLTDIIDLQQALYTLNRAETDISVANINVWQALLIKAAASGDFELFRKQVR
ncbi:MAG: TolC family protein [Chitinophagaceae bacterium]